MISAEIILDDRRVTKKGYPLKIRIYDSLEKIRTPHKHIPLKIYQKGTAIKYDSNLKRRSLELEKEVEYCNANSLRLMEAYEIILNGIPTDDLENEIQILELKLQQLYAKRTTVIEKGFISFTDDLIKERIVQNVDIKAYTSIKNILRSLILPLHDFSINSLSKEFLKGIEISLRERGVKSNSIKTYFTLMKVIFDEAKTRESLNIKKVNPFYEIKVLDKENVTYNLSVEDLINLKDLKLETINTKYLVKTTSEDLKRDSEIFLFQFAIGGHDLIDIANIKWKNIKKDRLNFDRTKNKNKTSPVKVDVFLSDYAKYIIKKYGDKSNERVFSFIPDPNLNYNTYCKYLFMLNRVRYKKIAESLGIDVKIKSKAPRYLFRTLAGNLLINDLIIMKIQGHKPQGITFGYQGVINHVVQDREHQKILDLVFK